MRTAKRPCQGDHERRPVVTLPQVDPAGAPGLFIAGRYFITLCAHNREHLFGEIIVQMAWEELARHYPDVELDAFVVMPNHVHGMVVILTNGVAEANPVGVEVRDGLVGAIHELPL